MALVTSDIGEVRKKQLYSELFHHKRRFDAPTYRLLLRLVNQILSLEKVIQELVINPASGDPSVSNIYGEVVLFSGTDGTLASTPSPSAALMLFRNGALQQQGSGKDYTIDGADITLSVTSVSGETFLAFYPTVS